jgi:ATP/maltotriose-dependent transcriptional regulator MalT
VATRVSASRLIGRASELAELEAAFDEAASGAASLAFVAGESGVGKSRLLHTFLDRAREKGGCGIGGECVELARDELPYAPLVAALRGLLRERDPVLKGLSPATIQGLAHLVPELDPDAATDTAEDRYRPLEALLTLLEALAEDTPMVLWLDDAHWADNATRHFLAFLAASLPDECRLLTVIAYRSDQLHRRHPMRPLLAELGRGRRVRRLELKPFDRGEVATQLDDILGAAPDLEVVERFFERSEGNPLFTEELLAAGADGRGRLPTTLRDALLLRIERLPETSRGLLRILSVGGRLKHDHFVDLCDTADEDELAAGLREAVEAQVIEVGRDDRYGFRHALLREVIYDDLLPGERAELHLRLAHVLEASLGSGEGLMPIRATAVAHHFNSAGDQPEALRTAVVAARTIERGGAAGGAAALFDRALALWPRVAEPETLAGVEHTTLVTLAARAHGLDADEGHAISLFEQALGQIDETAEPHRVAGILAELASARWGMGRAESARADIDRALTLLPESEPSPERAMILEQKARFLLLQGRFAESRDAADEALRAAEAAGVEDTKALVLNRLGLCLFLLGEEERGEPVMRESLELARRSGSNDQLAAAFVNFADALHMAGRGEEAAALAAEGEREITPGDRSTLWIVCARSEILFYLGRWDEAEAVLPTRTSGEMWTATLANVLLRRASLMLGRGDMAGARKMMDHAGTWLANTVEPQYIAPAGAMTVELELRSGNVEAAREAAEKAIDQLEFCSDDAARMALISAAATAVEAEAAERARDLGDTAELEASQLRAELGAARTAAAAEVTGRCLERAYQATAEAQLARARDDADTATLAAAAADAWEKLPRPYQAAMCRRREAEARAAAGEREAAGAAAAKSLATAEEIGSEWLAAEVAGLIARARLPTGTPGGAATDGARPDGNGAAPADEDPFGLTPRERQVLAALAEGATNREIAASLFMAEKTASVHVSRILAKLGVRSRTEAAAVAHRLNLS